MWHYEPVPPNLPAYQCEEIVERLPMGIVAERYGFQIKKGHMLCPFHNDSTPSCRVLPGNRGFNCWACGAGGDVIHFVARLLGLGYREAAARLDADFGLGLGSTPVDDTALRLYRKVRADRQAIVERQQTRNYWEARAAHTIRDWPRPATHEQAAMYGQLVGALGWLEYKFEESVYPEG